MPLTILLTILYSKQSHQNWQMQFRISVKQYYYIPNYSSKEIKYYQCHEKSIHNVIYCNLFKTIWIYSDYLNIKYTKSLNKYLHKLCATQKAVSWEGKKDFITIKAIHYTTAPQKPSLYKHLPISNKTEIILSRCYYNNYKEEGQNSE